MSLLNSRGYRSLASSVPAGGRRPAFKCCGNPDEPRKARIVELRFFAGLDVKETAVEPVPRLDTGLESVVNQLRGRSSDG